MTEWLANLSWRVIIVVCMILTILRFALGRMDSRSAKTAAEASESLAIALAVVYLIIKPFLVQAFFIPSASMHPTLLEHDHIIVNKLVYRIGEPKHGDVVVFRAPPEATEDGKEKDFIKRVIGLPGDTLEVRPGSIEVGGQVYDIRSIKQYLGIYGERGEIRIRLSSDGAYVNGRKITKRQMAIAAGDPNLPVTIHPGYVIRNGKALQEPYAAEDPEDAMYPIKLPPGKLFMMGDNRNNSNDSRVWGMLDRSRVQGKAMFIFWPFGRIRWVR